MATSIIASTGCRTSLGNTAAFSPNKGAFCFEAFLFCSDVGAFLGEDLDVTLTWPSLSALARNSPDPWLLPSRFRELKNPFGNRDRLIDQDVVKRRYKSGASHRDQADGCVLSKLMSPSATAHPIDSVCRSISCVVFLIVRNASNNPQGRFVARCTDHCITVKRITRS
jgi:hypothetical protein